MVPPTAAGDAFPFGVVAWTDHSLNSPASLIAAPHIQWENDQMNLQTIRTKLMDNLHGNALSLSDDDLGFAFLNTIFHNGSLNLQGADLEPSDPAIVTNGSLTLHGTTDILDIPQVSLNLALSQPSEDEIDIVMSATLPAHTSLGIPGLNLDDVVLRFSLEGNGLQRLLSGSITGNTSSGPLGLCVTVPSTQDTGWLVSAGFKGDQLDLLVGWLTGMIGDILGEAVPVSDFHDLEQADVTITFDPMAKTLLQVSLNLAAPSWKIVDDFTLQNLQILLEVDHPMDSADRAVSTSIQAVCVAGSAAIPVALQRAGTSGDWTLKLAQSVDHLQPGLGEMARAFGVADFDTNLPPELSGIKTITLGNLQMAFNPATQPASRIISQFSLDLFSDWELLPGRFAFNNGHAQLDVSYPADATGRKLGARLSGTVKVGQVAFDLSAQNDKEASETAPWVFSGGLQPGSEIKLAALFDSLAPGDLTLPPEVPDITLSSVVFSVTPQTDACSFQATCAVAWSLPFGVNDLLVSSTEVHITRDANTTTDGQVVKGALHASVGLLTTGPVTVVDGLIMNSMELAFAYDSGLERTWVLSGTVGANLFDRSYTFKAGLQDTAEQILFSFEEDIESGVDMRPLVDLGSVGTLDGSQLAITVAKQRKPGTTEVDRVKLNSGSEYTWSVSATGMARLLDDDLKFNGILALHGGAGSVGLAFKPVPTVGGFAEVAVPLPAAESIKTHLGFEYFDFSRTTLNGRTAWTFKAEAGLWFSGLPDNVQKLLPASASDDLKGTFEAGTGQDGAMVAFSLDPLLKRQPFTLPSITVADTHIDLSQVKSAIEIGRLQVAWSRGRSASIALEFALGLPSQLNEIFGTRDGKPVADLFVTYDEAHPDSLVRFRLATTFESGGSPGFEIQPETSPFKKLTFTPVQPGSQDMQAKLDLGEYGKLSFLVPAFGYAGGNFRARGGFTQQDLAVPLAPLKWILKAIGLESVNHLLPDKLSIEELPIYSEQDKKFNIDVLFDKIIAPLQTSGASLPAEDELRRALANIADRAERLPERLLQYLDIKLPEQFYFDFNVSPQGGLLGGLGVYPPQEAGPEGRETPPVRLMLPGLAATGPVINGIELWNLSVGEILGGALLLVKADLNLDQFDLLPLAVVMALPDETQALLPDTKHLTRRLILDHLVMLVVPEALVAIPLFFNQLGFENLGLDGVNLQAHFAFPEPSLDLKEALQVFKDFKAFFTTDALLQESQLSGVVQNMDPEQRRKMDLLLTLGPLFADLPSYLGGKSLGSPSDSYSVSLYANLVHLLNGLKKLQVNDLILAIPKQYRSSPQPPAPRPRLSLGPLMFYADWLVDAPPGGEQGLLLHLEGGSDLADGLATLNASIDLKADSLSGFDGSFSVSGSVGDFIELELDGSLVVDTSSSKSATTPIASSVSRQSLSLRTADANVILPGPTWTPQTFTIEWWLNPQSLSDYNQTISGSDVWGSFVFHTTASGGVYAGTDINTRFTPAELPSGTVERNIWQHFAVSFDRGSAKIYKNGRLLASKGNMAYPAPWTGLHLGMSYPNMRIDGQIAGVCIWDHVRTEAEIGGDIFAAPTGQEKGLTAYWPLDDGTGTTVRELTGHFPGDVQSGSWQPSTPLQLSGLFFNGQTDEATMPGPVWAPQAFTVEWWLNPNSHIDWNQKLSGGNDWGAFVFHTTNTGAIYIGTDVSTRFTPAQLPDGTVELNAWQHFAFTFDNGHACFYKNGKLLADKTAMAVPTSWNGFHLGLDGTNRLSGRCAEVRIWDHARSRADIGSFMFTRPVQNTPGLVACWPLDDGAGAIAHDFTGHYPGSIQGAHWVQPRNPMGAGVSPVHLGGDCRMLVAGQPVFTGHMRVTGESFWFQGLADLIPHNPVIQAKAAVEGWLSAQELYLSGAADVLLGEATLANARATITNRRFHLEGGWLGGTTQLDIEKSADESLVVQGKASLTFGVHIDFVQQAIEKLINNQWMKVANSLHLDLDVTDLLNITIDNGGFRAAVQSQFMLNGHNNSLPTYYIGVAPTDISSLVQEIKQQLSMADPSTYFDQLFSDTENWLSGIASGVIGWNRAEYDQMGLALRNVFRQTADEAGGLLKKAGYSADELLHTLQGVFTQGAGEGAKVLARVGYQLDNTMNAVIRLFGTGVNDTAAALRQAGFDATSITNAFRIPFNLSNEDAAKALKYAGFTVNETAEAIRSSFNFSQDDVAKALKIAGFNIDQVTAGLMAVFSSNPDAIRKALESAGFPGGDILAALRNFFGNLGI